MNKILTFMRESSTARFFIPLGLLLVIFGVVFFIINTKNQDYIKIEATVLNVELEEDEYIDTDGNQVEAKYNVTIQYTVDGKDYTNTLENVSKYNVGDKTTVYYNPKDPTKITQTKTLIIPIIMIILGIVSFVGGIISASNAMKRYKKMKEQERSWENGK